MLGRQDGVLRSPTFFVGAERARNDLETFQRREQQLSETYNIQTPLCFNAHGYQKTHPVKVERGHTDADARLETPVIIGVADGVSQIEDFGINPAELPHELLKCCETLAKDQLLPHSRMAKYCGPIPLVVEAFQNTESLGSTTLVLALLDNSTKIHGNLFPMIAVITIGDCELLILRRVGGVIKPFELIFHTEMQRLDGHSQTPLQLARVDARIDANFHDGITLEVIERGSAVHCISAHEGDIIIMGSDGVFDNMFLDEIVAIVNSVLVAPRQLPTQDSLLSHISRRVVEASHRKTYMLPGGIMPDAPIGKGGKMDDTSCVVAEVVQWTAAHQHRFAADTTPKDSPWHDFLFCGSGCAFNEDENAEDYDSDMQPPGMQAGRSKSRSRDDDHKCLIS